MSHLLLSFHYHLFGFFFFCCCCFFSKEKKSINEVQNTRDIKKYRNNDAVNLDDSNIQVSPTGRPLKIISNRFSASAYRQSNEPDQVKLKKEQQQVY